MDPPRVPLDRPRIPLDGPRGLLDGPKPRLDGPRVPLDRPRVPLDDPRVPLLIIIRNNGSRITIIRNNEMIFEIILFLRRSENEIIFKIILLFRIMVSMPPLFLMMMPKGLGHARFHASWKYFAQFVPLIFRWFASGAPNSIYDFVPTLDSRGPLA